MKRQGTRGRQQQLNTLNGVRFLTPPAIPLQRLPCLALTFHYPITLVYPGLQGLLPCHTPDSGKNVCVCVGVRLVNMIIPYLMFLFYQQKHPYSSHSIIILRYISQFSNCLSLIRDYFVSLEFLIGLLLI